MTTTHEKQDKARSREILAALEKIVVTVGVGRASQQPNFEEKVLPQIIHDVEMVAGQKPQLRRAKKSIAGFKLRQGQIVGLRATLRQQKMVDFFERFTRIVLPRVHDFRGIDPSSVDAGGSLNTGVREQYVFPEINPEESLFSFSLGVNIVPRKKKREEALDRYRAFGVPLRATAEPKKKGSKKRKNKEEKKK